MKTVGEKISNIILKNQDELTINISDKLKEYKYVLIAIYPKDDTPGCTVQMCSIRDDYKLLRENGIFPVGLNHDSSASHKKFVEKYNYQFDILVDTDRKVINDLGATKMFFNNKVTQRSAFLIDSSLTIVWECKGQQDHKEIINFVKEQIK